MALSWNEIKERAVKFSKEWAEYSNEEADAKPFLVEFFNIFGIYSKKVATFEHRVKKLLSFLFADSNFHAFAFQVSAFHTSVFRLSIVRFQLSDFC